jgi:hypothetical protein
VHALAAGIGALTYTLQRRMGRDSINAKNAYTGGVTKKAQRKSQRFRVNSAPILGS